MKVYRVVQGYLQLKFSDKEELVENGKKFPMSVFNIVVDSPEVAEYLIDELGVDEYELLEQKETPTYLKHELN
mgnify:CR=1 FL=1